MSNYGSLFFLISFSGILLLQFLFLHLFWYTRGCATLKICFLCNYYIFGRVYAVIARVYAKSVRISMRKGVPMVYASSVERYTRTFFSSTFHALLLYTCIFYRFLENDGWNLRYSYIFFGWDLYGGCRILRVVQFHVYQIICRWEMLWCKSTKLLRLFKIVLFRIV